MLKRQLDRIYDYRLPLAKELFDDRLLFNQWLAQFQHCQGVLVRLRKACKAGSLEHELEAMREQAQSNPWRHKQLAAVQFYLQSMLWTCKHELNKDFTTTSTNYKELLVQIEDSRIQKNEKVCLVTFNYDTMLEDALPLVGVEINNIDDYVAYGNYKIIKLHGSVNWAHRVADDIKDIGRRTWLSVANELVERIAELNILQEFRIVNWPLGGHLDGSDPPLGEPLFPALAIPVENKQQYECPKEQYEALSKCIPEVDRILLIGWRATEKRFIQLLKERLPRKVHIIAANGDSDEGTQSIRRLRDAGIRGRYEMFAGGFSQFVSSGALNDFSALENQKKRVHHAHQRECLEYQHGLIRQSRTDMI